MSRRNLDWPAELEAALYAAGRPLTLEEIMKVSSSKSRTKVMSMARAIAQHVNSTMRAIEVVELPGHQFVMQLRPSYSRTARRFSTRPLVPNSVLKTLSYIVYFQPVSSLDLASKRGSRVYRHVKTLEEMGLVEGEKSGRSTTYRTSHLFSQYFGLSSDIEAMKKELSEQILKVGHRKGLIPTGSGVRKAGEK